MVRPEPAVGPIRTGGRSATIEHNLEVALRVAFLLWGPMRRASGRPRVEIDLPEETSLAFALDSFYEAHPDLIPHRATARAAVGVDYADSGTILHDGDEISLIPPVQGG